MGGGREPGHVGAGLGHDDLRDRLPDPWDGLQQVDLVLPRPARLDDDRVSSASACSTKSSRRNIERASRAWFASK